jgi:peptide deformylase
VTVRPIRLFGDPVLSTPAIPVEDFDKELRFLVRDLTDTMLDTGGAGLAAPQLGVGLRVFTYYVDHRLGHLVNPTLDLTPEEEDGDEGCLSLPGLVFPSRRSVRTVAKGFNVYGDPITIDGRQSLARCLQHETDHLDGIMSIDRLAPEQRAAAMKAIGEAEWSDRLAPIDQESPHPTSGTAR